MSEGISGEFVLTGEQICLGEATGVVALEPGGVGLGVRNMPRGTGKLKSMVTGRGLHGVWEMK